MIPVSERRDLTADIFTIRPVVGYLFYPDGIRKQALPEENLEGPVLVPLPQTA